MRNARLWRTLLGVEKTVIETMEMDDDGVLVFSVRVTGSMRHRCGRCQRRCPRYDLGDGRRRWRSLDSGSVRVELEADSPRVSCRIHGVSAVAVPWARHGSGHTHHFDAQVAWLARSRRKFLARSGEGGPRPRDSPAPQGNTGGPRRQYSTAPKPANTQRESASIRMA